MSKVDQEQETDKYEDRSSDERDIARVEDEEAVRNKEGCYQKSDPCQYFGTPPSTVRSVLRPIAFMFRGVPVLDGCSTSLGVIDTDKKASQDQMKEAESEVDPMDL